MTVQFARLLAALALMLSLGFGMWAVPVALAQDDTATEVTEEGEGVIEEIQEEGEDALDTAEEEVDEAVDSAQTEAAQVTDDDDDFDDWRLLGLLGLLGLGGLLKRPNRSDVVDQPSARASPLDRT